jgi:hypothetical protein
MYLEMTQHASLLKTGVLPRITGRWALSERWEVQRTLHAR